MKTLRFLLLTLTFALSLGACDGENDPSTDATNDGEEDAIQPEGCWETHGDLPPETLNCEDFSDDLTLVDDLEKKVDYLVTCEAVTRANLVIEEGVVIEFGPEAGLSVEEGGRLQATGGACPVILRAESGTAGGWKGLLVASDAENTLHHVEIIHAGGGAHNSNGDLGGVILWAEAKLHLSEVKIAESAAAGLHAIYTGSQLTMGEGNQFTQNAGPPLIAEPNLASSLSPSATYTGNGEDFAYLTEGEMVGAHVWSALEVPYRLTSVTGIFFAITIPESAEVTLEPGVRFLGERDTAIAAQGGSFNSLDGEEPSILASVEGVAGGWAGLYLEGGEGSSFSLVNLEIREGGGAAHNSNGDLGGLVVWSDTVITLEDVQISKSASHGLTAIYGGASLEILGDSFFRENEGAALFIEPNLASHLSPEASYLGNGLPYVLMTQGALEGAHSWAPIDVPYQLESTDQIFFTIDVGEGASLNLEAGVSFLGGSDVGILVSGGALSIEGTETSRVVLEGVDPSPGSWKGLFFDSDDKAGASFSVDHAQIAHAGGGAFNSNGDLGAIVVWDSSDASVTNTTFSEIGTPCAIHGPYDQDEFDTSGSDTDGSASLLCDPD